MDNETQWPTTTGDLRQMIGGGLDWTDVLLFVGKVAVLYGAIVKAMPFLAARRSYALAAFAPVVARRMIFGSPDRGVMRTGALSPRRGKRSPVLARC